jgi:hypothetical protein
MSPLMRVYHRTDHAALAAILRDGFRDGSMMFGPPVGEQEGVFVSAYWPLDASEGAYGDAVLELDVPEELFAEYEHVEEGKTYREAMVPADELNQRLSTARVLTAEEEAALTSDRFDEGGWQRVVREQAARWGDGER